MPSGVGTATSTSRGGDDPYIRTLFLRIGGQPSGPGGADRLDVDILRQRHAQLGVTALEMEELILPYRLRCRKAIAYSEFVRMLSSINFRPSAPGPAPPSRLSSNPAPRPGSAFHKAPSKKPSSPIAQSSIQAIAALALHEMDSTHSLSATQRRQSPPLTASTATRPSSGSAPRSRPSRPASSQPLTHPRYAFRGFKAPSAAVGTGPLAPGLEDFRIYDHLSHEIGVVATESDMLWQYNRLEQQQRRFSATQVTLRFILSLLSRRHTLQLQFSRIFQRLGRGYLSRRDFLLIHPRTGITFLRPRPPELFHPVLRVAPLPPQSSWASQHSRSMPMGRTTSHHQRPKPNRVASRETMKTSLAATQRKAVKIIGRFLLSLKTRRLLRSKKEEVQKVLLNIELIDRVTVIQAMLRGKGSNNIIKQRMRVHRRLAAAIRIKRAFRQHRARRQLQQRKRRVESYNDLRCQLEIAKPGLILLFAHWKGYRTRKEIASRTDFVHRIISRRIAREKKESAVIEAQLAIQTLLSTRIVVARRDAVLCLIQRFAKAASSMVLAQSARAVVLQTFCRSAWSYQAVREKERCSRLELAVRLVQLFLSSKPLRLLLITKLAKQCVSEAVENACDYQEKQRLQAALQLQGAVRIRKAKEDVQRQSLVASLNASRTAAAAQLQQLYLVLRAKDAVQKKKARRETNASE